MFRSASDSSPFSLTLTDGFYHPTRCSGGLPTKAHSPLLCQTQFLTSHFAFDLAMERYLQMIDPRTSLPIWDFMIDSSLLGYK